MRSSRTFAQEEKQAEVYSLHKQNDQGQSQPFRNFQKVSCDLQDMLPAEFIPARSHDINMKGDEMTRRTLLKSTFTVSATTMAHAVAEAAPAGAQERTVYEPSASDPRIVAAMAARRRMEMSGNDVATMETLFAPDLVVNSPVNMVVSRDNVLARMRSGQISYEDNARINIEFVGVRGDSVVIMGEEMLRPNRNAPNAGRTIRRRFTDIWKNVDGVWKLAIRQATVTSVQ